MNIQKVNTLDSKNSLKRIELENIIITYINKIIKFDIELGRGKENFHTEDYNIIINSIDGFRSRGFRIFIGGGNMFFLKIEKKLTGWLADCIHMRGLARRKITIKEMI